MEPRVTVLLPTHNRDDVLGYAVQSVLWQTAGDFELLIVGDGCTDKSADVVAGFNDPRIRWFDLPKAPLSGYANRNIALREARGRYVAYAQHDDIWFPDHLEKLVATLDASGADWAYSLPLWAMPDGVMIPMPVNLTHSDELDHFLQVENWIPSTFVMHSRDALERVGHWPEDVPLLADWRCWQRIIKTSKTHTAGYCAVPTALHFWSVVRQADDLLQRRRKSVADSGYWPTACQVAVQPGEIEQQCFFQVLSSPSSVWIDQVRAAVPSITDRLTRAWTIALEREWRTSEARWQARWTSRKLLARQLIATFFQKSRAK